MIPPSGAQHVIRHGDQRAVVVEVGGGLREYSAAGREVLDGYAEEQMADGGRGQPLLPWPNRIADGRYEFDGEELQLPINEVARNCAIHGLTRWSNWAARVAESQVSMTLRLHPEPGYPFTLDLSLQYTLAESGLEVRTRAVNVGARPAPFGAGFHPYLSAGRGLVDDVRLQLPSAEHLQADERGIPNGRSESFGGELDFTRGRPVGPLRLDTCFTQLARDGAGRAEVRFGDVTLWMDSAFEYLMVFTGDTLEPGRRRRGLAVEPMTCAPNAFISGAGLIVLKPGGEFSARWGIRPSSVD